MKTFDIVIVGGGPGGYVAALRASNLGKKVALIEKTEIGGTCLNRGCIPSKTFLRYASVIESIEKAKTWGIETGEITFSLETMQKRNEQVMQGLRAGVLGLLNRGKIAYFTGEATINEEKHVTIHQSDGEVTVISGEKVIIATGGTPFVPDFTGIENISYYTSDTIFNIDSLPTTMAIIGGGVIGVEFANIFSSLGVKVTVIEMANQIVPNEDQAATDLLQKHLEQRGVQFVLGSEVKEVKHIENNTAIHIQSLEKGQHIIECEDVLVAVGRKPNLSAVQSLNLKMSGPFIAVNSSMETNLQGIYAIGDIVGGYQLAHVASAEGIVAAHHASGEKREMDYKAIPRCIYTTLEIASIGLNEKQAKEKGISNKVKTYHLAGNGKAITMDEANGFIKIIVEEKYGEIIGVVMVGPNVTEMITQATAYMVLEGTVEELEKMIQPHPSLSESMFEVAASFLGKGIHT